MLQLKRGKCVKCHKFRTKLRLNIHLSLTIRRCIGAFHCSKKRCSSSLILSRNYAFFNVYRFHKLKMCSLQSTVPFWRQNLVEQDLGKVEGARAQKRSCSLKFDSQTGNYGQARCVALVPFPRLREGFSVVLLISVPTH